jgi:hypothetical protein
MEEKFRPSQQIRDLYDDIMLNFHKEVPEGAIKIGILSWDQFKPFETKIFWTEGSNTLNETERKSVSCPKECVKILNVRESIGHVTLIMATLQCIRTHLKSPHVYIDNDLQNTGVYMIRT